MQIISNVALISINETLFIQLISFLVFLFIMNRIMFKPLRSTIDRRDQRLFDMNKDINDTKQRMTDILDQLKKKEALVREEANAYKETLKEQGSKTAAEIYADFQKTISELKQKTEDQVNSQIFEARKQLETESEILAKSIMEKMLNRRLES